MSWRTLRQWRGPKPEPRLARTSGLWLTHPQRRLPTVVPTADQHPKYSGETNPGLWLDDYRLACQAGGADSDSFIIHNLPLFLADSARTWLEHLPPNLIQSWANLKEIFMGNFQGTYACILGTHGISKTTDRSPGKHFVGTSGASPSSATSCPTSPTLTS